MRYILTDIFSSMESTSKPTRLACCIHCFSILLSCCWMDAKSLARFTFTVTKHIHRMFSNNTCLIFWAFILCQIDVYFGISNMEDLYFTLKISSLFCVFKTTHTFCHFAPPQPPTTPKNKRL